MKRIGIISDTHLSESGSRSLPARVFASLRGVDFIVHAGDFTSRRAMRDLEKIAPLVGVRGNNDPEHLGLPDARRLTVEGVTLGVCHGDRPHHVYAPPLADFPGNQATAANAISHFEFEDDVRCIIFGHSHRPLAQWHTVEGRPVLLLNPGSPTDKRWNPHFGCALLVIEGDVLTPDLMLW